jgi:crotonobetainyl-CoA:carnitine CoA-transferase CaiB-like acyl-CoA transferase
MLPLDGVRVLDMSHMMQGPWAAEILGDLGADVVKLEAPAGERGRQSGTIFVGEHSAQYLAMNRNKRSAIVDLKSEDGITLARRLIERADILIQNFRPGTLEKFGLGWDEVHELNPRLIYCRATGYGSRVPDLNRPGQDLLAQARTGMTWLSGHNRDEPVMVGPFVADIHAATMLAVGALAALHTRERTGLGQLVEIDLVGAALHQQVQEISSYLNGHIAPKQHSKPATPYIEAPYGCYKGSDGKWLAISLAETPVLAGALGRPELTEKFPDKASADVGRDEYYRIVDEAIATAPADEWIERLTAHGVWCAPVNDYDTMREDPMVAWEDRVVRTTVEGSGELELMGNPLRMAGDRLPLRLPPPLLGEHSAEVAADDFWKDGR